MAFAFNAALIKNDEVLSFDKPKISKDNLTQLLKPTLEKSKDVPSEIDIANLHSNIQEDNANELAQFYQKESTPYVFRPSEEVIDNPMLNKVNYILELLEQQKEIKTNQKNEEIVLYCFLGLFIIYILDSFVSIGKYSR
jgi:hypothetical protein